MKDYYAKLSDVVDVNPTESIPRGSLNKKIALKDIEVFTREIKGYEVTEYKGGPKFRNGDTVFARITPTLENGKTAKVTILEDEEVAFGSTELIVLRAKNKKMDEDYLYYLAISENFRNMAINLMTGTSGRKRVEIKPFSSSEIYVPSLHYQEKTGKLLSSFDDKIESNSKIISYLEEYSQLLFYKWFVDFNFPNIEGKPYRENDGEFIKIDNKLIPKNWEYEKLGKGTLSKLIPSGIDEFEGYKCYIPTSEIQGNIIISEGEEVTMKDKPSRANMQPRVNSVWFAKMQDSVKHIFIPKNENYLVDNYIFSTGMSGLQCNDLSFYYISCIINSEKFERKKDRLCIGSTQKAINNNGIKSIKILRPSDSVLEKFNTEVGNMIEQIELLKHENKLLEETRDLLIKKLIK